MKKLIILFLSIVNCQLSIVNSKAQTWSTVLTGIFITDSSNNGVVKALAVYNNELYAGGIFSIAGGDTSAHNILKWNGANWSEAGTGLGIIQNGVNGIYALTVYNSELYAAGDGFTITTPVRNIVKWNGTLWSVAVPPAPQSLFDVTLGLYNGDLVLRSYPISEWNGTTLTTLGIGFGNILALTEFNGELYAGGQISTGMGDPFNGIAKWNGTIWSRVGSSVFGIDGFVNALAVYNGNLYAAGAFQHADGVVTNNIAKWNGTVWAAVGAGVDNFINTLVVYNGALYAGGLFNTAGGNSTNCVARWNDTTWSAVGTAIGVDSWYRVDALCGYNGYLYAAGFYNTTVSSAPRVSKWSGPLGIAEPSPKAILNLYPNPAKENLTLTLNTAESGTAALHNLLGATVQQCKVSPGNNILPVAALPAGVYFLTVKTAQTVETRKIIKE